MDPKKVKEWSDEDIDKHLDGIAQVLVTKSKRGREVLDALRKFYQIWIVRPDVELPDDLLASLIRIIDDDQSQKIRTFAVAILLELLDDELPALATNLNTFSPAKLWFLLPLVVCSYKSLSMNIDMLVNWIIKCDANWRTFTFPALLISLRRNPPILNYRSHIQPIESQLALWLGNASRLSAKSTSNISILGLTPAKPQPITEIDGSASQDMYTILSVTSMFTDDQLFNIQSFPLIYSWLLQIYKQKNSMKSTNNNEDLRLNSQLKNTIISYCNRLIEQTKLTPEQTDIQQQQQFISSTQSHGELRDSIIVEVLRIYDVLCSIDNSLVPQIFPTVHKLTNVNDKNSGNIFIGILQFVLNHGEMVDYDPEPLFRAFLDYCVGSQYHEPTVAFETLYFFSTNKHKILSKTKIFTSHFPTLLKLFAWNPELGSEMLNILPCFIGQTTFLELFHTILDLPLLTASLVAMHVETQKESSSIVYSGGSGPLPPVSPGPINPPPPNVTSPSTTGSSSSVDNSRYRVLYNQILRNESGVSVNLWSSSTMRELLDNFCNEITITPRLNSAAWFVPSLLELYFDVIIGYADEAALMQLVPDIFERLDQLFPLEGFQSAIHEIMVQKILAIFEKFPHFIVSLKDKILAALSDHSPSREQLILHLSWCIGEYASPSISPLCTPKILSEYDDSLELFAFERMSIASFQLDQNSTPNQHSYNNQLMSVLITALSKLAARLPALSSRVSLCLHKVERYKSVFHPAVIARAEECLAMLHFPSMAAVILDSRHNSQMRTHHIDRDSSLPFLLQPVSSSYGDGDDNSEEDDENDESPSPLHQFLIN